MKQSGYHDAVFVFLRPDVDAIECVGVCASCKMIATAYLGKGTGGHAITCVHFVPCRYYVRDV